MAKIRPTKLYYENILLFAVYFPFFLQKTLDSAKYSFYDLNDRYL